MERQEILEEIVNVASSGVPAEDLAESIVSRELPELYSAAVTTFGSWTVALASALIAATSKESRSTRSASSAPTTLLEAPVTRVVNELSEVPLYLTSHDGHLLQLPLKALPVSDSSKWHELPDGPARQAWPSRAFVQGDDETFFILGSAGCGGSLIRQHFIPWSHESKLVRVSDRIAGLGEDTITGMFPRRQLRQFDRLYAFSTDGQIKASEADEYAKRVGAESIDIILPRDGEAAIAMFAAEAKASIFVASSAGKAIVFSAEDVRSQGRKAQGMRAILLDDGASAVSAFPVETEECVLVTAQGFVKRMSLEEFRPQGRGGAGLQTCKLAGDDRVIAILPASVNDDLLFFTEDARYLRLPVWKIPLMGRPARGERMAAPPSGERITDVIVVPPGHSDASLN